MTSVEYNPVARFDVETTDLVYLEHESGSLEATIYQPQGKGPFPGLLNVHGGRWFLNDRSEDHSMNLALASSGIVVVAVDFRLAPQHPYPAQIVDANYATRWMKAQARQFNIDPASVGAMGCSSGGHTVALNGMRPKDPRYASLPLPRGEDFDASLRFMLCCWPVVDPHARYTWAREIDDDRFIGPTESYFTDHASLHEGNPQEALERGEAVELPPAIIIQGTNDSNIPLFIPQKFEAAYRAAGGDIELELFPGMPHRFGNMPGPESERAIELMKGFIARQLARPAVAPVS
jgi:acetyl esterase